ncbi:DUF2264 domain-containing protein [Streptomyces sp. SB3404]|uniref:DUF2264 domain-containing protein n=2 Tax=Streptomyces boncukensis TaxID=2711219 RepID=A0A6G4X303_9ACTN|nr:DUF2264 domain-containing protein [Streptomyces boncukensis]
MTNVTDVTDVTDVTSTDGTERLALPPEDRELSPYTGWTRAHWEAAADGLLRAAWRWASPHGALLDLPGRPSRSGVRSDGLEGYARTFLAAAFRTAGARGADPLGLLERYADGLAAGTRTPGRDDAESWPLIRDHTVQGQPMVESASVALGLRLTRPWLWDRLGAKVQDRAEAWLRDALRHTPAPNNWYLFPLSVAGFLQDVGRGDAETAYAIERGLELLEGWYAGEGWYADGDRRSFDHYNGWALHLYPVLHAHLAGDAELLARYGPRLREHLTGFGRMFDGNGAPLYFGRSLTYRFAAGAAIAAGALTGHTPLAPGTSRRLLSGALSYFLNRGALAEPDGLLTLGWHGPHEATLQPYSGPASPYWASKAFVALLAPQDDPLWTAREEPAPSEGPHRAVALPVPGLLVQTGGGLVRVHNHGSDDVPPGAGERAADEEPLYARFAYSTRTGPTARANVPDNHLALEPAARSGGGWSVRRRVHPLGAAHADDGSWGWAASWHRPVFPDGTPGVPGVRVESVTFVRGAEELRVHRVTGAPRGTRIRQTGWADAAPSGAPLRGLYGWGEEVELRAPQGTAFERWVRVPGLLGAVGDDGTALCAAWTSLAEPEGEPPRVTVDGPALVVRWPEGPRVRIAFGPLAIEVGVS